MTITAGQAGFGVERLRLSRVCEQTFSVLRQDFALLFLTALLSDMIPGFLHLTLSPTGGGPGVTPLNGWASTLAPIAPFVSIVGGIISLLAYGALSWASVERLQGRKPVTRAMLTAGSNTLLTNIGLVILGSLGILAGFIVFVVPGVILAAAWLIVIPVATCEKSGVFSSFKRSASLTKGSRWPIFLLLVIFWIAAAVLIIVATTIGSAVFGIKDNLMLARPTGAGAYIILGLQIPVEALVRLVLVVGVATVYHELRALKGGFDTGRLSEVFS